MKTIIKMLVATIVAIGMACVLIAADASDNMVIVTFFCVGIMVAAALGVFDERERSKHESIKHYDGRRNYGHAAVFVGTACLFIGTPKECDTIADDLQHYAQQARVDTLTGEETLEVL
jgi:hypothetical protein